MTPTSSIPPPLTAVPVLRRRARRRTRGVSRRARIAGRDTSSGIRHAGRVRRARVAAVRPTGNALGSTCRPRTTNDARRADRRRGLGRRRTHRRHRCVFDVGCRCAELSGGSSDDDPAVVVRSIRQPAEHAGTARTDRPDESAVVAGRASRGGGTLTQSETDVWLLDSARQTRFTHASAGTFARLPLWSPDGTRLAFESVRASTVALSAKPSGQDGPEEVLFASPETKIPCDWSTDGRFLVYYVPDPKSGTDRWVLPTDTRKPFVFLRSGSVTSMMSARTVGS